MNNLLQKIRTIATSIGMVISFYASAQIPAIISMTTSEIGAGVVTGIQIFSLIISFLVTDAVVLGCLRVLTKLTFFRQFIFGESWLEGLWEMTTTDVTNPDKETSSKALFEIKYLIHNDFSYQLCGVGYHYNYDENKIIHSDTINMAILPGNQYINFFSYGAGETEELGFAKGKFEIGEKKYPTRYNGVRYSLKLNRDKDTLKIKGEQTAKKLNSSELNKYRSIDKPFDLDSGEPKWRLDYLKAITPNVSVNSRKKIASTVSDILEKKHSNVFLTDCMPFNECQRLKEKHQNLVELEVENYIEENFPDGLSSESLQQISLEVEKIYLPFNKIIQFKENKKELSAMNERIYELEMKKALSMQTNNN